MTITVGSTAAGRQGGRHGTGAVAENLHPYLQVGSRAREAKKFTGF